MKQSVAVYQAIISVFANAGIQFEDGMNAREMMSDEQRSQVRAILETGFSEGKIDYKGQVPNGKELKDYVSGLVSNWLRKDKRLNGNTKYTPKNPGSRTGSTDDQVKALRALLAQTTDTEARNEIQGFLDSRLAEIGKSKAKVVTINVDALPAELKAKYIAGRQG